MTNIDLMSISSSLRKCARTYTLELTKNIKSAFDEHPDFHDDKSQERELRSKLRMLLGGGDASRLDNACNTLINDHRRRATKPAPAPAPARDTARNHGGETAPGAPAPSPAGRGRTVIVVKKKKPESAPAPTTA